MTTAATEPRSLAPEMALWERSSARAWWARPDVLVCAAGLAVMCVWLLVFPYTADGDSVLHYLNARDSYFFPAESLHPWARPGFKLFLAPFAIHGIIAARLFMACVASVTVWQTIRLADDLNLPRAYLAGAMVLWQPMAFAIASDTMTEFPMALGLVIAARLWINGYRIPSCLVLGYLPSVRPEGFFFGVVWGFMVLFARGNGPIWKRGLMLLSLCVGPLLWIAACVYWTHDWLHVIHIWNWPVTTYESYGRGSIFHHVIGWPGYSGVPLTVLFLLGVRRSWNKSAWLVWTCWAVVFGVHSILYWGGWFCSCGLMRIMACTAPFTAVICLYGWNASDDFLARKKFRALAMKRIGVGFATLATVWTLAQYFFVPEHFDCFPLLRCTAFIQQNHLITKDTWYFDGNKIAQAALNVPPHRPHVAELKCDPVQVKEALAKLPTGSIGIWDNRQAQQWHGHTIEELTHSGFSILYDTSSQRLRRTLRYVVLRKDRVN